MLRARPAMELQRARHSASLARRTGMGWPPWWLRGLAATLLAMGAALALADALDGVLEVRSAYVNIDSGVFLLHARVEYPINPDIRDALRDGVTLTFDLDTRVERERRMWLNATVVDLTL